jgi:serine/threonine-protein kinase HipA
MMSTAVEKINVFIKFEKDEIPVGELLLIDKSIFFRYDSAFIKRKIELSPFKLKLNNETKKGNASPFEGLFGVFADSLPDGWGRLLVDRAIAAKGIDSNDFSMLDRLALVGKNGPGALIYQPSSEATIESDNIIELDKIAKATLTILEGESSDIIEELFALGGSSGGARPKIQVGYNPKKNHLISGAESLPKGYEHWIIKFSSSFDPKDIANIEYAYHLMAKEAKIEMSECRIFTGKSGRSYFGTKRFDRIGNNRLHLHSVAGLLNDDFRMSMLDYGHILDCAYKLEKKISAYDKVFRLACFNVLAQNKDDHSKNFAFLMNEKGEWQFAPAFDLTFSSSSHGMHSTMVAGESKDPTLQHLMELGNHFKIKNKDKIIDEVQKAIRHWPTHAQNAGVSITSKNRISKALKNKKG